MHSSNCQAFRAHLGRYTLIEQAGRGGFAEVWRAWDTLLQRPVAIKIVYPEVVQRPELLQRFRREARVLAALRHPNIIQIHASDSYTCAAGYAHSYLIMPFVEGPTLEHYLRSTACAGRFLPTGELLHLLGSLGSALDYAHIHGVVHRDIKPSNILIDVQNTARSPLGEPLLSDFGLVKVLADPAASSSGGKRNIIGTPQYLAPEVLWGERASPRSDLYGLGLILYELCTGGYPFPLPPSDEPHPLAVMRACLTCEPIAPALLNPALTPPTIGVLLKAIARDPAARFPSAASLTQALREAVQPPALVSARTPGRGCLSSQRSVQLPFPASLDGDGALPSIQDDTARHNTGGSASLRKAAQKSAPPWHRRPQTRHMTPIFVLSTMVVLGLISGMLASVVARSPGIPAQPVTLTVGSVTFLSSNAYANAPSQGINDLLRITLHHLARLPNGMSYYGWLEGGTAEDDLQVLPLGRLAASATGEVQETYRDPAGTNLLAHYSRFLVTEENSALHPSLPSSDVRTWRYTGEISARPDPRDSHSYSLLDHLRHLLAADPTLELLGLKGGLSYWTLHNIHQVSILANSLPDAWQSHNTVHLHRQLTRILDYLDGVTAVMADVPHGTPFLADPVAARPGLLAVGPDGQDPPAYLAHIVSHLLGLSHAPGASNTLRTQAAAITHMLDSIAAQLEQLRMGARQLLQLADQQILQPTVLAQTHRLVSLAAKAYGSPPGLTGKQTAEGAQWLAVRLQGLAVIQVQPRT